MKNYEKSAVTWFWGAYKGMQEVGGSKFFSWNMGTSYM